MLPLPHMLLPTATQLAKTRGFPSNSEKKLIWLYENISDWHVMETKGAQPITYLFIFLQFRWQKLSNKCHRFAKTCQRNMQVAKKLTI